MLVNFGVGGVNAIVSCNFFLPSRTSLNNVQCWYVKHPNSESLSTPYTRIGFPLLQHFLKKQQTTQGGFNLGGINATGQIPDLPGNFGLIDKDTPREAYTKKSYTSNEELVLVFSDEFNTDGRTFYPGDDPYWEAVDLHYWGTVRVVLPEILKAD